MKDLFESRREELTGAERRAIWERIRIARPEPRIGRAQPGGVPHPRANPARWWIPIGAAGVLAAAALMLLITRPEAPPTSGGSGPQAPPTGVAENQAAEIHARSETPASAGPGARVQEGKVASPRTEPRAAATSPERGATGPPLALRIRDKGQPAASQEVVVTAERPALIKKGTTTDPIGLKAGVIARGGALHMRGGRSGETLYGSPVTVQDAQTYGATQTYGTTQTYAAAPSQPPVSATVPPPVLPTTGGTTLPNDEVYDSMFFEHYGVNPFIATDEDSLSTFAVDVDAASYTIARRYIELGHLPPKEAVRVEEFVNFFPQGYPSFTQPDFRIFMEGAPSAFGKGYQLLRIGVKGRTIPEENRKPADLTFVIDCSGSMAREDRLGLVKQALRLLLERLRGDDRVAIVIYGSNGRVLLEPTALDEADRSPVEAAASPDDPAVEGSSSPRERILAAIDRLAPEGSTNLEEGLYLGYDLARRALRPGRINRILLCTDGVANNGLTSAENILQRVRKEADKGIQLTAIGFGMGNYNDVLLEKLADKGDGNYYYVDDLREARRVLEENLTGTLQTIAEDAKLQVEFDPRRVLRYRLLGFENRDVADRDFRNDKVDAGEVGSGHEVTALYELKLATGVPPGRLATVRLRYACPGSEGAGAPDVREIEEGFDAGDLRPSFEAASPSYRLDAAVAEFAEILRHSYWARESSISSVLPVARKAAADLPGDAAAQEFVKLAESASGLSDHLSPEEKTTLPPPAPEEPGTR